MELVSVPLMLYSTRISNIWHIMLTFQKYCQYRHILLQGLYSFEYLKIQYDIVLVLCYDMEDSFVP